MEWKAGIRERAAEGAGFLAFQRKSFVYRHTSACTGDHFDDSHNLIFHSRRSIVSEVKLFNSIIILSIFLSLVARPSTTLAAGVDERISVCSEFFELLNSKEISRPEKNQARKALISFLYGKGSSQLDRLIQLIEQKRVTVLHIDDPKLVETMMRRGYSEEAARHWIKSKKNLDVSGMFIDAEAQIVWANPASAVEEVYPLILLTQRSSSNFEEVLAHEAIHLKFSNIKRAIESRNDLFLGGAGKGQLELRKGLDEYVAHAVSGKYE